MACLAICCIAPFAICPLDCLSACGCADVVACCTDLPGKSIPCTPCNPNVKNPLWFCSEPLGWAASHGQLHTVMELVRNGANPETVNMAGFNAFTDAERERHHHVVNWLNEWKAAGKPTRSKGGVVPEHMDRDGARGHEEMDARKTQGCYFGACFIPCLITSFWVQATSADEMTASGMTLCIPWSHKVKRVPGKATAFTMGNNEQTWTWHSSACCFVGTPGWWALKILPGCAKM